jgi:hypothetical protein
MSSENIVERRRRSKNAGTIHKKHRIILRTIATKTQIGTKKERTRNNEGIHKRTKKRINKDHQRKLELRKK